jgi:hypothetical protein
LLLILQQDCHLIPGPAGVITVCLQGTAKQTEGGSDHIAGTVSYLAQDWTDGPTSSSNLPPCHFKMMLIIMTITAAFHLSDKSTCPSLLRKLNQQVSDFHTQRRLMCAESSMITS